MQQAKASEDRIRNGNPLSILDGIPISIKSNIAVEGLPFTASSKILGAPTTVNRKDKMRIQWLGQSESETLEEHDVVEDRCGYDSYVAQQLLRRYGAILIGLTNMDEFGMGSLGANINGGGSFTKNPKHSLDFLSRFEQDSNPALYPFFSQKHRSNIHDDEMLEEVWTDRIRNFAVLKNWQQSPLLNENYSDLPIISAGGSSCGAAASVAMGSSLASIGTDTGGSVRLPAAWCGIVGVKPSYGLISRRKYY